MSTVEKVSVVDRQMHLGLRHEVGGERAPDLAPAIAEAWLAENAGRRERRQASGRPVVAAVVLIAAGIVCWIAVLQSRAGNSRPAQDPQPPVEVDDPAEVRALPEGTSHVIAHGFTGEELDVFRELPSLRRLVLRGERDTRVLPHVERNRLSDDDLRRVARCGQLVELHLDCCDDVTVEGLGHLVDLPRLRRFAWSGSWLRDDDLAVFARFPALEVLELFGQGGLQNPAMERIGRLGRLRGLVLNGPNRIDNEGFRHLAKLQHLQELDISDATDAEAFSLAEEPTFDPHARYAVPVGPNGRIVDDETLATVAQLPDLRVLRARRMRFTEAGLRHLAGSSRLRELDLSMPYFLFRGPERGTGLRHLPASLEVLRLNLLRNVPISAAHLRTLRSRSLKKLQLIGTRVETDEETTTLADLLDLWPDCVIVNADGVRVHK